MEMAMSTRDNLKERLGLTDADFEKPLPAPTRWSLPFWEGTKEGKLLLKRCTNCGTIDHPPYLFCTNCSGEEAEWIEASGKATLYAYAINVYGVPFPFIEDLPYVLGLVDIEEGPRMISNIVGCAHEDLKNGMPLEVVFEEAAEGVVLPKWRPAAG
jgi:uncharacterized OB-fold protein